MKVKDLSGIASLTAMRTICAFPDIDLNQTNDPMPEPGHILYGTTRLDSEKLGKFEFLNTSIIGDSNPSAIHR